MKVTGLNELRDAIDQALRDAGASKTSDTEYRWTPAMDARVRPEHNWPVTPASEQIIEGVVLSKRIH